MTYFGFEPISIIPRKLFYNGEFASKPIQSVCYDQKNQKFVVGFSQKNSDLGTLAKMTSLDFSDDSNVEFVKTDLDIGHCNDMAYHPKQHKIYIARGDNRIAVVNPETLIVEKLLPSNTLSSVWQLSLYSDGSLFVSDSGVSVKYDANFRNPETISNSHLQDLIDILHLSYDRIDRNYAGDWQGSVIIGDIPYMVFTEWNGVTDEISGDTRYKSCVLYSPLTKEVKRFPTFMEVENACVVGNRLYFVLGNVYIGSAVMEIDCNETHFSTARTVHKEISTNTDLDRIFTPGLYRSKNYRKTQTLKNLPNISSVKEAGFTLDVINTGLDHIRQTIYSNNFWTPDAIYTRGYSYDYGWGDWYCLELTKADKNQMYQTVSIKMENVSVPTGNADKGIGGSVVLDVSNSIPEGYTLYSTNIDCECKSDGKYYTLPFANDRGQCTLRIQRIIDNKITIRSNDEWGQCTFWITAFCKRTK